MRSNEGNVRNTASARERRKRIIIRKNRRIVRRIMSIYMLMLIALTGYIIYFALVYAPKIAKMDSNYIIHLTK